jgi:signal transduction histidine kinase
MTPSLRHLFACFLVAAVVPYSVVLAAGEPPLVPIADVLTLPREDLAQGKPVRVRGVVTICSPMVAIQEDGKAIWIHLGQPGNITGDGLVIPMRPDGEELISLGMIVEVEGVAYRGGFAPTIRASAVRIIGEGTLPQPVAVDMARLFRGGDNALRVVVGDSTEVVAQGCRDAGDYWNIVLAIGDRRIMLKAHKAVMPQRPDDLIDARVRVIAALGATRNSRGEFVGPNLALARAADITVVEPPAASPFEAPRSPLDEIAAYRSEPESRHRIQTEGTVTCTVPGRFCYIQDGLTGVRVECTSPLDVQVGDRVRVAGFVDISDHIARLVESVVERVGKATPITPLHIAPDAIADILEVAATTGEIAKPSNYAGVLIHFPADLAEIRPHDGGWFLTLAGGRSSIIARLLESSPEDNEQLASLAAGSQLRVTGVVQLRTARPADLLATGQRLETGDLSILLRSGSDIEIVRKPLWWTARRLAVVAGMLALALTGAFAWVALLRRQVAIQSLRIAAEQQSRHEAAVEFQATLRERNRLAGNLHDTVLQTVIGIGYQLSACRNGAGEWSSDAPRHFGLVDRMVQHAVRQLRSTVWALRATVPRGRSLPESLAELAARLGTEHDQRIAFACNGDIPPVPDFVAGNLLLVAQEALLNAVRHAGATSVSATLARDPEEDALRLVVEDDGVGFAFGEHPGPREGHFGLAGMAERVDHIRGSMQIDSGAGAGCRITVTIPCIHAPVP